MQRLEFDYKSELDDLLERNKITEPEYQHFQKRGSKIIRPADDGFKTLGEKLPIIFRGVSDEYVDKMKVPYQATSFLAAAARPEEDVYVFKIPNKKGGGVELLTGGQRRIGDNVFASTHRILQGYQANMVSAKNWMANKDQIWNWKFFGNNFKETEPKLYEDLVGLAEMMNIPESPYHIIIGRKKKSFEDLNVLEEYKKNNIAALNPENNAKVIFLTNDEGHKYLSSEISESEFVHYVNTGEVFDIQHALEKLTSDYKMKFILNDGGREMSNGIRDAGLLAEERITLEPYPGEDFIDRNLPDYDQSSVLAWKNGEIKYSKDGMTKHALKIHSQTISHNGVDEKMNVYLYPLDEKKIF